jgi:DNA-binding response OmpR family regulator
MASREDDPPTLNMRSPNLGEGATQSDSCRRPDGLLRFGPFDLDFDRYELRIEGMAVKVEPRTFDLLALLACNRGRTVTRD